MLLAPRGHRVGHAARPRSRRPRPCRLPPSGESWLHRRSAFRPKARAPRQKVSGEVVVDTNWPPGGDYPWARAPRCEPKASPDGSTGRSPPDFPPTFPDSTKTRLIVAGSLPRLDLSKRTSLHFDRANSASLARPLRIQLRWPSKMSIMQDPAARASNSHNGALLRAPFHQREVPGWRISDRSREGHHRRSLQRSRHGPRRRHGQPPSRAHRHRRRANLDRRPRLYQRHLRQRREDQARPPERGRSCAHRHQHPEGDRQRSRTRASPSLNPSLRSREPTWRTSPRPTNDVPRPARCPGASKKYPFPT